MADEETQGQVDTSWWGPEGSTESSEPSTGFDEPLIWPESLAWDGPAEGGAGAPMVPLPEVALNGEFVLPPRPTTDFGSLPDLDVDWELLAAEPSTEPPADPDATVHRDDPLGGLGGGAGSPAPPVAAAPPDSIWAGGAWPDPGDAVLVATTMAPAVYAETERGAGGSRWRRFGVRGGNAAVIALISLVSLVLLGMFLSVRGRGDDVPTDVSQQRPPGDEIAVTGPLNTVPFSPTTSPPGSINIAALVPATETTDTSSAPATTVAATRSTAPATTAAPTQPTTATTAAPATTTTASPATTTPVDSTQPSTTRRTTTSFTLPPYPTTSVPSSTPTSFPFTIPSF